MTNVDQLAKHLRSMSEFHRIIGITEKIAAKVLGELESSSDSDRSPEALAEEIEKMWRARRHLENGSLQGVTEISRFVPFDEILEYAVEFQEAYDGLVRSTPLSWIQVGPEIWRKAVEHAVLKTGVLDTPYKKCRSGSGSLESITPTVYTKLCCDKCIMSLSRIVIDWLGAVIWCVYNYWQRKDDPNSGYYFIAIGLFLSLFTVLAIVQQFFYLEWCLSGAGSDSQFAGMDLKYENTLFSATARRQASPPTFSW